MKMTKNAMITLVRDSVGALKAIKADKAVQDSVNYTLKAVDENPKNVTIADLKLLVEDVMSAMKPSALVPVEALVKKSVKKAPEVTTPEKLEEVLADKELAKELGAKPKKSVKKQAVEEVVDKKVVKKSVKKSPVVTHTEETNDKTVVLAEHFPETYEAEGVGSLVVLTDKVKNMKDLVALVESGKDLYFMMYWNSRHLSQFKYDTYEICGKNAPKSFPDDLDLCQLIHVSSDDGRVAYLVSAYTEVMYVITPDDLKLEDGMRFASGVEYNIYTLAE